MNETLVLHIKGDISNVQSSLAEMQSYAKTLRASLKQVPKEGTKAFDELAKKISKDLNISITAATKKIKEFQTNATTQVQKTTNATKLFNAEMRKVPAAAGSLNAIRQRAKALTLELDNINVETQEFITKSKELSGVNNRLRELEASSGRFGRNVGNYTSAFKGIGRSLASAAGFAGVGFTIAKGIGSAVNIVKDYNEEVSNLKAISQATTKEMALLTNQAKVLGATTVFSATQVLRLQTELAKLGFNTDQILKSTEAIENFAIATGSSAADAAAVGGAALRAFGLDASETERVVSVLAVATTKSALNFGFIQTALSTVAPVAKTFGFTIEETTALLGTLANAGFDASSAATATRNILLKLADGSGDLAKALGRPIRSFDDLVPALNELNDSGINLSETLELTDKRSVAAFNQFLKGADSANELKAAITGAEGGLQNIVDIKLDNITGDTKLLKSAWEGFILSIDEGNGVVSNSFRSVTKGVTSLLTAFTNLNNIEQWTTTMGATIVPTQEFTDALVDLFGVITGTGRAIDAARDELGHFARDIIKNNEGIQNLKKGLEDFAKESGKELSTKGVEKLTKNLKNAGLTTNEAKLFIAEFQKEIEGIVTKKQLTDIELLQGKLERFKTIDGKTIDIKTNDNALKTIDEIRDRVNELERLKGKVKIESDDFKKIQGRIDSLNKEIESISPIEIESGPARGSVQAIQDEISKLKEQLDKAPNDSIASIIEKLVSKEAELERVNNHIKEVRKSLESPLPPLDALDSTKELNDRLKSLNDRLADAPDSEYSDILEDIVKTSLKLDTAKEKISDLRKEIERQNGKVDVKEQLEKTILAINEERNARIELARDIATSEKQFNEQKKFINLETDNLILEARKSNLNEYEAEFGKVTQTIQENLRKIEDVKLDIQIQSNRDQIELITQKAINAARLISTTEQEFEDRSQLIKEKHDIENLKVDLKNAQATGKNQQAILNKIADKKRDIAKIQLIVDSDLSSTLDEIERAKQAKLKSAYEIKEGERKLQEDISNIEFEANKDSINARIEAVEQGTTEELALRTELSKLNREKEQEENDYRLEKLQEYTNYANELLKSASDAYFTSQREKVDRELTLDEKRIEESYAKRLEAVKGNADAVALIEKEKEKELEKVRRAAFEKEKRLSVNQAFINIALGVTKALASSFPPANFIQAAIVAAQGAIQIAAIESRKFVAAKGGVFDLNEKSPGKAGKGGYAASGRSHTKKGNPVLDGNSGRKIGETERGEAWINKVNTSEFYDILSYINSYKRRGVAFPNAKKLSSKRKDLVHNFGMYRKGGVYGFNETIVKYQNGGLQTEIITNNNNNDNAGQLINILIFKIDELGNKIITSLETIQNESGTEALKKMIQEINDEKAAV